MIRAVVIDDEFDAREIIKSLLQRKSDLGVELIGECDTVDSAIAFIDKQKPQLVFLDLHLFDRSGFDILEGCTYKDFYTIIITAHENYGIKAVKAGANDYLLKPVSPSDFTSALEKMMDSIKPEIREQQSITVKVGNGRKVIPVEEILYIQADNNYSIIHLESRQAYTVARTLKHYELELDEAIFYRSHQSYLVNLYHIDSLKPHQNMLILKNQEEIPVSRRNKRRLTELFYEISNDVKLS